MNYDITLEQSILSLMIEHPRCAEEAELLSESDFTSDTHKKIFRAIIKLVRSGTRFDELILIRTINREVGQMDLEFLAETHVFKSHWRQYVKQLKDLSVRRRLYKLADAIKQSTESGEILSELAEKEIFAIRENILTEDFVNIKDLIMGTLERIEETQTSKGRSGLETGFADIDDITDGLQNGNYILLGARPSMGKTALAVNIATNVANNGKKVAFFSLEMAKEELSKRIMLSESMIPGSRVKDKQLNERDYSKMAMATSRIANADIYINDTVGITVAEMKSMCRKRKRSDGLDLVVIDYLQYIAGRGKGVRREQVEDISRDLKKMAKELNVPVLIVSSLNRSLETRENKRPILSDLRETGQIEYDADLILFLHRENYYNNEAPKDRAELIVAKQRNGELGIVDLTWAGSYTRFFDLRTEPINNDQQLVIDINSLPECAM